MELSLQFNSFYNLNFPLLKFFKALQPRLIEEKRFIPISKEVIDISTITFWEDQKYIHIIASKGTSSYIGCCGRVKRNFSSSLPCMKIMTLPVLVERAKRISGIIHYLHCIFTV